jgi:hypothetical protein
MRFYLSLLAVFFGAAAFNYCLLPFWLGLLLSLDWWRVCAPFILQIVILITIVLAAKSTYIKQMAAVGLISVVAGAAVYVGQMMLVLSRI